MAHTSGRDLPAGSRRAVSNGVLGLFGCLVVALACSNGTDGPKAPLDGPTDAETEPSETGADGESVGASAGQTGSISPSPGMEVRLSPALLSTAMGERPTLEVEVFHPGVEPAAVNDMLLGSVSVESEKSAVAIDVQATSMLPFTTTLTIIPTGPLAPTWHSLVFVTPGPLSTGETDRGEWRVVFHPDSLPRVAKMEVCNKGGTTSLIQVDFSEAVTWATDSTAGVMIQSSDSNAAECDTPELVGSQTLTIACAGTSGSTDLSLRIHPGALRGVAADVDEATLDLSFEDWAPVSDSCVGLALDTDP